MRRRYILLTILTVSSLILGITGCAGAGIEEAENGEEATPPPASTDVTEETPATVPADAGTEDIDDLEETLAMLGLAEEEISFEGYLSEADLLSLHLTQGESGYLVEDSEGYGSETWFFTAGENTEDTLDIEEYTGEYELPDYAWQELADSMLSEEPSVTPDITDVVVQPEELEEQCAAIKQQIAELESKLAEMKDKKDELEGKLNGAKLEKEKLEAEKEDLEAKKASCPDDITALQNEIPVLEGRVERMVDALRQDVGLYQDCKSRHPSEPSRCQGYLDCVGRVFKKLKALEHELAAKKEALSRLQQECVDLDSRIHLGITPKISQLNQAIQSYETDIANLSAQITELESKLAQIKERYQECLDELEELAKRQNQVNNARQKAEQAADDAEKKISELEKRLEEFKKRFPGDEYPGEVEKYRERLEEIRKKIGDGTSELDEEKVDEAKSEARDLEGEAEREKERLNGYWLANICLTNCDSAYRLCSQSVENRRGTCGLSQYFTDAEQALARLKECCDQARQEAMSGDASNARQICLACLRHQKLAKAVYDALKMACTDQLVISHPDVPEGEDLKGIKELVDLEKNIGLQAIGELGKIPSAIVKAIEAGKIIGNQQKNACCALRMLEHMLASQNYWEASGYADAFVHFWHEISGLPEIPLARTSTALGLAEIVDDLPEEWKDAAIAAIKAVLRSARCADVSISSCY